MRRPLPPSNVMRMGPSANSSASVMLPYMPSASSITIDSSVRRLNTSMGQALGCSVSARTAVLALVIVGEWINFSELCSRSHRHSAPEDKGHFARKDSVLWESRLFSSPLGRERTPVVDSVREYFHAYPLTARRVSLTNPGGGESLDVRLARARPA